MKIKIIKIFIFFLSLLLTSSCASRREIVQFQNDTMYLRNQIDAIRSENQQLSKLIQELNSTVSQQQEEIKRTRADLMLEMSSVKEQSQFLDSKLDDNIQRMSQEIHRTPLQYPAPLPSDSSQQNTAFNDADLNPTQLYNTAYRDLARGSYSLALEGFRQFLFNFPNSELADDAQYWIGEAFYAQDNFIIALEEFKILITKYPDSKMIPAALLKMGYCSEKRGDRQTARKYLDLLIQKYSHSEEAKLAKEKSNNLR